MFQQRTKFCTSCIFSTLFEQRAHCRAKIMSVERNRRLRVRKRHTRDVDMESLRVVTLDALKYVNKLAIYVPALLTEETPTPVVRVISSMMRRKLSKPITFAVLQLITRLSDFAEEAQNAFAEERRPMYPRCTCDMDYTVRIIWANWVSIIKKERERLADWNQPGWNPYTDVHDAFNELIRHIWSKHFLVKL